MGSYTLQVDGMSCTGCEASVTSEAQSLGQVSQVEADCTAGTVEFTATDASDVSDVVRVIEALGYPVEEAK
jgi:copper chaperone CopZ